MAFPDYELQGNLTMLASYCGLGGNKHAQRNQQWNKKAKRAHPALVLLSSLLKRKNQLSAQDACITAASAGIACGHAEITH